MKIELLAALKVTERRESRELIANNYVGASL